MNRAATLSILLAVAVMLLPWQICECGEDGPHLKAVWADADCHPADHPTPLDRSGAPDGEPEHACGGLFQFEGTAVPTSEGLPAPREVDAFARLATLMTVCTDTLPAREAAALVLPPGDPRPASPLRLATRLLL